MDYPTRYTAEEAFEIIGRFGEGVRGFPAKVTVRGPGDKDILPLVDWGEKATADLDELRKLWGGGKHPLCFTGLTIVDDDDGFMDSFQAILDAHPTLILASSTRGRPHYVYRGLMGNRSVPGGEIKSLHGCALFSGRPVLANLPIAPLPAEIEALRSLSGDEPTTRRPIGGVVLTDWLAEHTEGLNDDKGASFLDVVIGRMEDKVSGGEHRREVAKAAIYSATIEVAGGGYPGQDAYDRIRDAYRVLRDADARSHKQWNDHWEEDYIGMWEGAVVKAVGGELDEAITEFRERVSGDDEWVYILPESEVEVELEPLEIDPGEDERFWKARPELDHIRTVAQAQMAAPHVVLAMVLARVMCQVPPHVVLPPIIFDYASLNLSLAFVGPSGSGKDGSRRVASLAVDVGAPIFSQHTLGTGHGIAHGFGHWSSKEKTVVRHAESVMLIVEEVDHLAAHDKMQGSTVLSELRRFAMGEKLGSLYADSTRRVEIEDHTYRGVLVVAVQPSKADVLLSGAAADGGTPQRFYWASTIDPNPPEVEPELPEPWEWKLPKFPAWSPYGERAIGVWDGAAAQIKEARRARRDGRATPLDGHKLLTTEKLAAGLGFLNGHLDVTEDDWHLAEYLIRLSDQVRASVLTALDEARKKAERAEARRAGMKAVIVEEVREEAAIRRVTRLLMGKVPIEGWVSHSDLRRVLPSRDRKPYFDTALARLIDTGLVEAEDTERGIRYRKAGN